MHLGNGDNDGKHFKILLNRCIVIAASCLQNFMTEQQVSFMIRCYE